MLPGRLTCSIVVSFSVCFRIIVVKNSGLASVTVAVNYLRKLRGLLGRQWNRIGLATVFRLVVRVGDRGLSCMQCLARAIGVIGSM